MGSVAAALFGGAQKSDAGMQAAQAAQDKAAADAAKRDADLKAQEEARTRAIARGGRAQLIGPNGELGVTDAAAADAGKTKLGE